MEKRYTKDKNDYIHIRISKEDKEKLKAIVAGYGCETYSDYIRSCIKKDSKGFED